MNSLEYAIELAVNVHKGQKDRYGKPYILHPMRVMLKMENEAEMITAILHDVVEDSDTSLDELRKEGFTEEVVEAIDCLSKRDGEEYFDYIKRAISTTLSRKIKLADLEDNMDLRRIDIIQEKDTNRMKRYLKAWKIVKENP